MERKNGKGRLWGNILIAAGAVILLVTGVVVAREEWRRRETLARLAEPSARPTPLPPIAPTDGSASVDTPVPPSTQPPIGTATLTSGASPTAVASLPPTAPAATTEASLSPTSAPSPTPAPAAAPAPIVRMLAPAIELDTPVVEVGWVVAEQNGQKESVWETASYAAGHHKNSLLPGQGGNIVISGHHNIEGEVFRRLVDLKVGDEVTLLTQVGGRATYQVTETMIVEEAGASPEQRRAHAQYIEPTADERLTMITCWPYWTNTHRVIVIAKPKP